MIVFENFDAYIQTEIRKSTYSHTELFKAAVY